VNIQKHIQTFLKNGKNLSWPYPKVQFSVNVSDPDPGRPNLPHKKEEKKKSISCFEVLEVLPGESVASIEALKSFMAAQ
jgi:hypothetical protein